jgi:hypothetical protein
MLLLLVLLLFGTKTIQLFIAQPISSCERVRLGWPRSDFAQTKALLISQVPYQTLLAANNDGFY